MAIAGAADNYKLTLFYPSIVGDGELKPGDCQVEVADGHVTLKQGRKKVEADVRVETVDEKFKATSIRYDNGDGKQRISEIRLGGTTTKLVFN
jgi:hypothetical protein